MAKAPSKADTTAADNKTAATSQAEAASDTSLPNDEATMAEVEEGVRNPDGGTTQREPKPEDTPLADRITPAAEQLLRGGSGQVVGSPGDPATRDVTGISPTPGSATAGNAAGASTTNDAESLPSAADDPKAS